MDARIERQGLSVTEASHIAGIGRTKLYEAIGAGQLAVRKFGKRTIVLRDDLARFLAALPVTNEITKLPGTPAGRSQNQTEPPPLLTLGKRSSSFLLLRARRSPRKCGPGATTQSTPAVPLTIRA